MKRQTSLVRHRMSLQPRSNSKIANNLLEKSSNAPKSLAVHQKRTRSSMHRLVRQKSFDESNEQLNTFTETLMPNENDAIATTTTVTTTTMTDNIESDDDISSKGENQKRQSVNSKKITEVVESTMALSTEIVLQKDDDEQDDCTNDYDNEDDNERDDYFEINDDCDLTSAKIRQKLQEMSRMAANSGGISGGSFKNKTSKANNNSKNSALKRLLKIKL